MVIRFLHGAQQLRLGLMEPLKTPTPPKPIIGIPLTEGTLRSLGSTSTLGYTSQKPLGLGVLAVK